MRKIVCDRCGNEINNIAILELEDTYTHYDIRATGHGKLKFIDLCPSCEKEFYNWLHNKEN